MLVYVQRTDQTRIVVTCRGLMPGQQYSVRFGDLLIQEKTEFITNRNGGGLMRVTLDGDRWLSLPVSVRHAVDGTVLLSP